MNGDCLLGDYYNVWCRQSRCFRVIFFSRITHFVIVLSSMVAMFKCLNAFLSGRNEGNLCSCCVVCDKIAIVNYVSSLNE